MPHIMGDYLPHPPGSPGPYVGPGELPVSPPPADVGPTDPQPWITPVVPADDVDHDEQQVPPLVVIEPVELPPTILPPPPDMTPVTIVPPPFEDPRPLPMPVDGVMPVTQPPASIIPISAVQGVGTFMVYVGRKLVLTMAASLGTSLGKSAGAMLVGALQKQMFRGTTIRFHSGQSYGDYHPTDFGGSKSKAVSYEQAWRMVPQEFSYWEA